MIRQLVAMVAVLVAATEGHTSTHGGVTKSYAGFTCSTAFSVGESGDGAREVEEIRRMEADARKQFDAFAPGFRKRLEAFAKGRTDLDLKATAPTAKSAELDITGIARNTGDHDFVVALHLRPDADPHRVAVEFIRFEAAHATWLPKPTPLVGDVIPEQTLFSIEFLYKPVSLEALAVMTRERNSLALIAADPKRIPLRSDGTDDAKQRTREESLLRALSWHAVLTDAKTHHPEIVRAYKHLMELSPARIRDLRQMLLDLAPRGGEKALDAALPR